MTHLKSGCDSDWITNNTPFALTLLRFPPSPFPPETPDTQASLKDKLEFKIFSSPHRKPKNGQNIGWNYKTVTRVLCLSSTQQTHLACILLHCTISNKINLQSSSKVLGRLLFLPLFLLPPPASGPMLSKTLIRASGIMRFIAAKLIIILIMRHKSQIMRELCNIAQYF